MMKKIGIIFVVAMILFSGCESNSGNAGINVAWNAQEPVVQDFTDSRVVITEFHNE